MSAEPLEQPLIPALPRPTLLVLRHAPLPPHALPSPPLPSPPLAIARSHSIIPRAPPGLCSHGVRRVRLLHRRCRRRPCLLQVPPPPPFVICTVAQFTPMRGSQVGQVVSPSLLNFVNLLLRHVCAYGVRDVSWGCVVYGPWRVWGCEELGVVCYGGCCGCHRHGGEM